MNSFYRSGALLALSAILLLATTGCDGYPRLTKLFRDPNAASGWLVASVDEAAAAPRMASMKRNLGIGLAEHLASPMAGDSSDFHFLKKLMQTGESDYIVINLKIV